MQRNLTPGRPAMAALTMLGASVAIAACGGSSPAHSRAASAKSDALKYAACVRAHGVSQYPDPGAAVVKMTTGNQLNVAGHLLPESAQVVHGALIACQKYEKAAAAAQGPVVSSAQLAKDRAGVLAKDRCIRAHGVPGFPDQSVQTGPGGHGIAISAPFGAGSSAVAQSRSPTLKAAEKACNY